MDKKTLERHLFLLILCGGGGTRLWPRSRNANPKQFSRLLGKRSLLQITADRFKGFLPPERIFVVTTSESYARVVKRQLPRVPKRNIIYEPVRRNTAMAHGLGAVHIRAIDPEAIILNEYSDHIVKNVENYLRTFMIAGAAASDGDFLIALGIKPIFPHTGLGYIKAKKMIKKIDRVPVYKVEDFTEKPGLARAKEFIASGRSFWNAGLYVWKAEAIINALKKHEPKIGQGLEKIAVVLGTKREAAVMKKAYEAAPEIAVDRAVSERAKNFLMVEAKFDWVDIGDWQVVYDISKKDKNGNVIIRAGKNGGFVSINAKNNLIHFSDQLIAVVDVEDLIIVDTKDALLVARKGKAEEVKKLVKLLKQKGKVEYL